MPSVRRSGKDISAAHLQDILVKIISSIMEDFAPLDIAGTVHFDDE